ncbi:RhoGAP-domain-containing protein [Aulographum hederae CBS 113979]|uniref:RhoGAP-domain-containing protein n=1 Tax=Aulographum hederae CBS 113979 TaxID=1176131 RepID=A0A6G1H989_9PEZI|nr:RhoGAP-domain-containing protein [Aulographum hederae CBS 113979]
MASPFAGGATTGDGEPEHPNTARAQQYPQQQQQQQQYNGETRSHGNNMYSSGAPSPIEGPAYRSQRPLDSPSDRDTHRQNMPQTQDASGRELSPAPRDVTKSDGSRRPSGSRLCGKCGENLTGQFVRALGDTYHLNCFTCHDCNMIVASKFFPVPDQGPNQYPLCETDYFRRLDLLCYACGGALRASYITALDRKYHIEHFTCSACPTVFGAQDSYYEHQGDVYCHYHYSTKFAQRCHGCQNSILKQFVEIYRNGQNQHWHPECYMIHKYWNVRLHPSGHPLAEQALNEKDATDEVRKSVRVEEERIEEKVLWIWRTLSTFEEKSATCISDMLLHVSNGAYVDGVMAAKKFIVHVELLFTAADDLDRLLTAQTPKGLSYSREAKLLCKKVVAFFQLLSESQDTGVRRLGVTQELLSLVTGLAHYLKLLIRICLQGALKLERDTGIVEGLAHFLNAINSLDDKLEIDESADVAVDSSMYIAKAADSCAICDKPVEDRCIRKGARVFHTTCMTCQKCGLSLGGNPADAWWSPANQLLLCKNCSFRYTDSEDGFYLVSRLQQYVHLLKVAHSRLLASLRSGGALPHTSDDPNLTNYNSAQGHRPSPTGDRGEVPLLRSDTRSKSFGGSPTTDQQPASYEQTLTDIRRLRSTRMDKHLSNTMKRARSSRIIDGPEGTNVASETGTAGEQREKRNTMTIIHDRDVNMDAQLNFGGGSLALDDIPRLVAAEQAKEQRPNAAKYARNNLGPQDPMPKLVNGHRRDFSDDHDMAGMIGANGAAMRMKKYFSELSPIEYFIVRHVAVLSLEPLLEGLFNQEELLKLIPDSKQPTFWDKFGKAFKNDKNKGGGKKKGVFGRALEQVVEKDGADSTDGVGPGTLKIPAVVQETVTAMRNMDMSVEGVFRKNGNIRGLTTLSEKIDAVGCDAVDLSRETPVQVAALLKKYLRALPDPVLTFKLHKLFIAAGNIQDEEKRQRVLHLCCCLLPKVHHDTMEVLFAFLNWVSSFSSVDEETGSKMDIHNLATVVAPNILYSNNKAPDMDGSFLAIEAVHCLIQCNESMCEVPEDIGSIMNDSGLFATSADLTTKEILKRLDHIKQLPQTTIVSPGGQTPRSREGRSSAPIVHHIDTAEPYVWQNESSVRHVGPGEDLGNPSRPYAQNRTGSSERVNGSPHRNSQQGGQNHRGSGFQRQPGQLGIGAG